MNLNDKLLSANGKHVRLAGVQYRIISVRLGKRILADAEDHHGNRINMVMTRSPLGRTLRELVEKGLFV